MPSAILITALLLPVLVNSEGFNNNNKNVISPLFIILAANMNAVLCSMSYPRLVSHFKPALTLIDIMQKNSPNLTLIKFLRNAFYRCVKDNIRHDRCFPNYLMANVTY